MPVLFYGVTAEESFPAIAKILDVSRSALYRKIVPG